MSLTPQRYFELVPLTVDMTIRSELYHTNEFNFAVAVILSAQATDKKVNEVTLALFAVAPTPQKMVELGIDGLKEHIRVISFFNNKAKNIIALAERLVAENMTDTFPEKYHNRDELMRLPGIGQKTANVVCNVLWHAPNIGVIHTFFVMRIDTVGSMTRTIHPKKLSANYCKKFQKNITVL
jgi:endonuclease III